MKVAALVPVLLTAAVACVSPQSGAGPERGGGPGEPYLLLGMEALGRGEHQDAERYLGAAAELEPTSGDALYGLARLWRDRDARKACQLMEQALQSGRFWLADSLNVRLDLAALQLRLGDYEAALATLDRLPAEGVSRVEAYRIEAAAHLAAGRLDAALTAAEAGLRRYPYDAELHVLRAWALRRGGFPVRQLLELASAVAPEDPSLAAERALAEIAEGRFRAAEYAAGGKGDPRVFAEAFVKSPDRDLLERFFASGGNTRVDLLERVGKAAVRDPDLARRYEEAVRGYSGVRWVDANRDSYPEQSYEYRDGVLVAWSLDADQDGVVDARYDRGREELLLRGSRYWFAPYPYLAQVELERDGARWRFDLPPRSLQGPFLEGIGSATPVQVSVAVDVPKEATLAMLAQGVRASGPDGIERSWVLEAGLPVSMEERASGSSKARYLLLFRDGSPHLGRRDLDGDGSYDVQEMWTSGQPTRFEVDLDHSGAAEYVVDFARGISLWDYDEDGKPERTDRLAARGPAPVVWPTIVPTRGTAR